MFKRYGLYFAWLFSSFGVLGSLYFSEVLHIEPCNLCWYQRISLFPIAFILGIGAYCADWRVVRYTLPIAVIGLLFAIYQVLIQEIPGWNPIELCGAGPDCSTKIYVMGSKITIPMLSALNFIIISLFLIGSWYTTTKEFLEESGIS